MEFDRNYLDQELQGRKPFVELRLRRDATLRDMGVDPEEFKVWQRDREVSNETDTDEYRETQPAKGLHYIAEFFDDWAPGVSAVYEQMELVKKWLDAGANLGEAYSGAEQLVPILNNCFDFMWQKGGYSLYTSIDQLPDSETMAVFKEDKAS
jgi:hypothetical protein